MGVIKGEIERGKRTLEDNIHDEKKHNDDRIFITIKLQILIHTRYSCKAKIRSINQRNRIHGSEDWEQTAVYPLAVTLLALH